MKFISTGRTQIQSVKCCVLFDSSNGTIRHVHHVLTIKGADETAKHLIEKRTFQLAEELGLDITELQPLHVDANRIEPRKRYVVDLKEQCLIVVEPVA